MSRHRPGLSLDEHRELGSRLKAAREMLLDGAVTVANAYPKASRESRALSAALRAFDKAKSILDDAVCREHPRDHAALGCYYGGSEQGFSVRSDQRGEQSDANR